MLTAVIKARDTPAPLSGWILSMGFSPWPVPSAEPVFSTVLWSARAAVPPLSSAAEQQPRALVAGVEVKCTQRTIRVKVWASARSTTQESCILKDVYREKQMEIIVRGKRYLATMSDILRFLHTQAVWDIGNHPSVKNVQRCRSVI